MFKKQVVLSADAQNDKNINMTEDKETIKNLNTEENKPNAEQVPPGIARIRQEWRSSNIFRFPQEEETKTSEKEEDVIVFPEIDGVVGIGDYTLDKETVREHLALSESALERIIKTGEIDSILVSDKNGNVRRLFSEASVSRFQKDSAIDPEAIIKAAQQIAEQSELQAIENLRVEIEDLKTSQSRQIQQMKDMILLELRNLKEQDRDLASFVFELAEEIKNKKR